MASGAPDIRIAAFDPPIAAPRRCVTECTAAVAAGDGLMPASNAAIAGSVKASGGPFSPFVRAVAPLVDTIWSLVALVTAIHGHVPGIRCRHHPG